MLDPKIQKHIEELRKASLDTYDLNEVPRYLEEKTYLDGARWSFKDHEFQKDIVSDTTRVLYVSKCAQVGLTELQLRYGLAVARMIPYFSIIMTWPFATDAGNMVKTRMNPIIDGSPDLRDSIDRSLDNVEIKAIGSSLIYARGTTGTTAGISTAADMIINDEVDRSDPHTLMQLYSRIKHSRYKMVRSFGTPTVKGFGIDLLMEAARRKRHMCKCDKCNHSFVPNYHDHVKIPGFDGEKREITKYSLENFRWREAVLLCPKCGRAPSLQFDRRQWVVENRDANFEAVGYFVTPFSVPNIVTVPSLVQESTVYGNWGEFCNQALGETSSDSAVQLCKDDLNNCKVTVPLVSGDIHHMGIDVGQVCHIMIGRLTPTGELLVVYRDKCALNNLPTKRKELATRFRCLVTVIDNFPETAMVYQLQQKDKNLFGAVYHRNAKLPVYSIKMKEKDLPEGVLPTNQASINRNLNFDEVMGLIKTKRLLWSASGDREDDLFVDHCLDMRRNQELDKSSRGMIWVWNKSNEGNDHFFHALGYLHVACRLAPAASKNVSFGRGPICLTLKMTEREESRVIGAMR